MFGIPLKYIGLVLALVGVIATGYFAVKHYNSVVEKNIELKTELKSEREKYAEMKKTYENIIETVNKNDEATHQIIERTKTVEREIHAAPITTECTTAPSIQIAMDRLKESYIPETPEGGK